MSVTSLANAILYVCSREQLAVIQLFPAKACYCKGRRLNDFLEMSEIDQRRCSKYLRIGVNKMRCILQKILLDICFKNPNTKWP